MGGWVGEAAHLYCKLVVISSNKNLEVSTKVNPQNPTRAFGQSVYKLDRTIDIKIC